LGRQNGVRKKELEKKERKKEKMAVRKKWGKKERYPRKKERGDTWRPLRLNDDAMLLFLSYFPYQGSTWEPW